jgi:Tol biopolymer transport system component
MGAVVLVLMALGLVSAAHAQTTTRVSVASGGAQGTGGLENFWAPSVSDDGRFVAFASFLTNLVAGDTNAAADVFVHDRQNGNTTRVSVATGGTQANGNSELPSISADGRFVAFFSSATNLVSGDTNGAVDVFVHDRQTGETSRVSVTSGGLQATGGHSAISPGAVSGDGRWVVFESSASNLVAGDTNSTHDVFLRDRQTGTTTLVSTTLGGTVGNGESTIAKLTPDGRYVAFYSEASNLVSGDTNAEGDIFVRDLQTGTTTRVSLGPALIQANGSSLEPSISNDGRFVAFYSDATNLVAGDTNAATDVFVRDRQAGTTVRASVASAGTQGNDGSDSATISGNGRFVAFSSVASNLVASETTGTYDVFVRDLVSSTTVRVSVATDGAQGNGDSGFGLPPDISDDGTVIAFASMATNLVAGDTNGRIDVFVRAAGAAPPPSAITNAGFESLTLACSPSPFCYQGSVPGWTITLGADVVSTWKPSAFSFPSIPEGVNVLAIGNGFGGGSASQVLSSTLQANSTYTLRVDVGNRADYPFSLYTIELLAGTTVLASSANTVAPEEGAFLTDTLVYNVGAGHAALGQPLAIRLSATGRTASGSFEAQTNFDDVRLSVESATDTDGDGLPNSWEIQFGLNPGSSAGPDGASGDPDGDGQTNAQELAAGTHPRGTFVRYLAEGATGTFFDTRVALVNPGTGAAKVLLRFLKSNGTKVNHFLDLPALRRATVDVESLAGLSASEFSSVIESDATVVVDRTMSWDDGKYGSHAETAITAPAAQWYLAEGSTAAGFALFYLLQNPSLTQSAQVRITYLLPSGAPLVKSYTVPAATRFNIRVNEESFGSQGKALASTDVSAVIDVTSGPAIIVERAQYLSGGGQTFRAGHESAGVTAPALSWFLAEGATGVKFRPKGASRFRVIGGQLAAISADQAPRF